MSKSGKLYRLFGLAMVIVMVIAIVSAKTKKTTAPESEINHTITYNLKPTTLFFAGDIMLSRNVALETEKTGDYAYPFGQVGEQVRSFDISFANLESPFWDQPPYGQQGLIFKAKPEAVWGLTFAGFDILSTANNHSFDQGKKGINYTIEWLKQNNIIPVGTGVSCHEGEIIEKNGVKFGFLAYSYAAFNDGGKAADPLVCDWKNPEQIAVDVKALKARSDFVIVSTHMGTEYKRNPDPDNVQTAHKAVEAGADLIIGHHPHWIQTHEVYMGKYIFYSLGNFIFDQMWSPDTQQGLTVTVAFDDDKLKKIELRPVIIESLCCPRWANEEETLSILNKIDLTSPILLDKN